jgi:hypothetical protein
LTESTLDAVTQKEMIRETFKYVGRAANSGKLGNEERGLLAAACDVSLTLPTIDYTMARDT